MRPASKPLVWLHGEVKTPPLSATARVGAGLLLCRLGDSTWRIAYRVDPDAIVVADVFRKTTQATPHAVLDACRRRLRAYDAAARGEE